MITQQIHCGIVVLIIQKTTHYNSINMGKHEQNVLTAICDTAKKVLPSGANLILYGSRARGDAHRQSDWDLLLIVDKERIEQSDFPAKSPNTQYYAS